MSGPRVDDGDPRPLLNLVAVSGGCEGDGVLGAEEGVEAAVGGFVEGWIGGLAGIGGKQN